MKRRLIELREYIPYNHVMTALKLLTEISSPYTKVLITRSQLPLSAEILRQLASKKSIFLTPLPDPSTGNLPTDNYGVVIHFVGFEKESFAETIYHTTTLHKLMDLCLAKRGKFILVTPEASSSLRDTAINLVSQFGKNFKLDYRIVSLPPGYVIKDTATQIINLFIKNFRPPVIQPATDPFVTPVLTKPAKNQSKHKVRWPILILLLPWLAYAVQLGVWQASLWCAWNTWNKSPQVISCLDILNNVSSGLLFQQNWLPGVPNLERQLVASQQIARTNLAVNRLASLKTQLLVDLMDPNRDLTNIKDIIQADWLKVPQENIAAFEALRIYPRWSAPLQQAKNNLNQWDNLVPDLPVLLGVGRQSTVLVLVQDTWQARPSGGVVDTAVLIPLNNGQVGDMQLYTSDQLDGLLRGQVVPPNDFKKVTGETNWFLRDVGWMPNFPSVAQRAAWFVNKELGKSADMVIATNTETLVDLAEALGGVSVNGELVTKDSFTESRLKFVPEGTSSSLIKAVTQQVLEKIPQSNQEQWNNILEVWSASLDTRGSYVYYINPELGSLRVNRWNGEIMASKCSMPDCLSSSIFVANSNIGMNQANRWIKGEYAVDTTISPDQVNSTYTLKYSNSSSTTPEVYKNYLRLYLSGDIDVSGVRVGDQSVDPSEFTRVLEGDYTVVSTTITVPAGATQTVEISTRQKLSNLLNYQILWYNQPGESNYNLMLKIRYPSDWKLANSAPPAVASGASIEYNSSLRAPNQVNLTFTHGR